MLDFLMSPARAVFCEPDTGIPWFQHPADTVSNIGPILAGLIVLIRARHPLLKFLGASGLWMGIASAIFHASGTLGGEALDLHGMFLFIVAVGLLQHESLGAAFDYKHAIIHSLHFATYTALAFLMLPWFGTPAFALIMATIIVRQWTTLGFNRQWYGVLGTFAVAYACWVADFKHWICYECNHVLTLHGAWHLLNGWIVWQVYKLFSWLEDEGE